ncbi:hypothetical protein [Streptomyces sp. NPDC048442]|uniref:hypothetical protein n=1 Tax=Streptomyces sp. NPDC048442 TaxID=3154823 RepID=UPI0034283A0D
MRRHGRGFALGGACEKALTDHLGRLYQVPRTEPRAAERAIAYARRSTPWWRHTAWAAAAAVRTVLTAAT